MQVMLLNPPASKPMIREGRCQSPGSMRQTSIPQLSLACMGRLLKERGAGVDLVESMALDIVLPEVVERVRDYDLVLVNTTTPTFGSDMEVVRALKEANPTGLIGVFGTHATALHREVVSENPAVDFVIRGEPEETAEAVYLALEAGKGLDGVKGITWREDGEIREEETRPFAQDLDRIAVPDRTLLPNHTYVHPLSGKPYTVVNVSRGCPGRCIFCVAHLYYGHKLRKRSIHHLLDELEGIHTDHVWMYADEITADRRFLRELCRGILDRGLKLRWWSNTRADVLDEELYHLMARSGCFMLSIGGESGSKKILDRACKRIEPEDIRRTVKMLRSAGIISLVYFLFGLPGETRETVDETIDFARKIGPDYVEFYPAVPYPGTKFWDIAHEESLVTVDDFDRYECGGTDFVVKVDGLDLEELQEKLMQAYRQYYMRPGYMPILLRRLRSPREFAKLLGFGFKYFKRFASSIK